MEKEKDELEAALDEERTGAGVMPEEDRELGEPAEDRMEAFRRLNRTELVGKMAEELPWIRKILGISDGGVAAKIGMDPKKYKAVEKGLRDLQWPEYMSLVFLFWSNEDGREALEEKGLFPDALKNALSISRNAHAPGDA